MLAAGLTASSRDMAGKAMLAMEASRLVRRMPSMMVSIAHCRRGGSLPSGRAGAGWGGMGGVGSGGVTGAPAPPVTGICRAAREILRGFKARSHGGARAGEDLVVLDIQRAQPALL